MKLVIQRVTSAKVTVEGRVTGEIGSGLLILAGSAQDDTEEDLDWLAKKVAGLRIFSDENGKMNLSVKDIGGSILVVSQFTLFADCKKGFRPSFTGAGSPEKAELMCGLLCEKLEAQGVHVEVGEFGADMKVSLLNDGPVTILLDRLQGVLR